MRVLSSSEAEDGALPKDARGAVAALGNFDGMHRGHAGLLAFADAHARRLAAPLAVITFEPHPRRYFSPDCDPFRLTTAARKLELLEALGVQIVYQLPFTPALANKSAGQFVAEVLVAGLGVRAVIAGANFRFGRGRGGTLDLLRQSGAFEVWEAPAALDAAGAPVSSSRIRSDLAAGHPQEAAAALGRAWDIPYSVETGDRRGRELGYPTANGRLGELLRPAFGIYAVHATTEQGRRYDGVANIGVRPMWRTAEPLVETHLFDFDGDLYGQQLSVSLEEYLRPEVKFASIEALKRQMAIDCRQALAALKSKI